MNGVLPRSRRPRHPHHPDPRPVRGAPDAPQHLTGIGVGGVEHQGLPREAFEQLLRNERRIEFCFEGKRSSDLTRWGVPLSERNVPVYRAEVTAEADGSVSYGKTPVYTLNLRSPYLPIPYVDMQRAAGLVQNEGWSNWSRQ